MNAAIGNLAAPAPLQFLPLAALTPAMANSEYAKARYLLVGRDPDDGLRALVLLTQRLTRSQMQGFLVDRDVPEHIWTAAELSGIVDQHGVDTVQTVIAAVIDKAMADPTERVTGEAPVLKATPYLWRSPETLPKRDWRYGRLLVRKFLSTTVAPGGVGKSSLVTAEALAQASGKPLLGVRPERPLRVWLWNLEDPQDETARRIHAAALHFGLTAEDIGDRLFVDSGREQRLVIGAATRNGAVIVRPVVDGLIAEIKARQVDIVVIDPFVSCHEASENDNGAMDKIAKEWAAVADRGDCAVHLVHHTRKLGGAETEVTTESSRGAKALTALAGWCAPSTACPTKRAKIAAWTIRACIFAPSTTKPTWPLRRTNPIGSGLRAYASATGLTGSVIALASSRPGNGRPPSATSPPTIYSAPRRRSRQAIGGRAPALKDGPASPWLKCLGWI